MKHNMVQIRFFLLFVSSIHNEWVDTRISGFLETEFCILAEKPID